MHIELVNPREITDVSADMLDLDDLTFLDTREDNKLIFYYSKNIIWVTRHEGSTFIVFYITFCDFTHVTLAATNIPITPDSIITSLHSSVFITAIAIPHTPL